MSAIVTIFLIILLLVIFLIAYLIYEFGAFWNGLPDTDCGKYASESAAVGTTHGPKCGPGSELFGGVCYKDTWTEQGGKKTAICTVDFGKYEGVYTKCDIGIYYLNYGDTCTMVGPDYRKTAVCTCQKNGIVTSSQFCRDTGIPRVCEPGWDFYGSVCWKAACPEGRHRSAICTCACNA